MEIYAKYSIQGSANDTEPLQSDHFLTHCLILSKLSESSVCYVQFSLCLVFVMSSVCCVQCLLCLLFACPGFVMSSVYLSRVSHYTVLCTFSRVSYCLMIRHSNIITSKSTKQKYVKLNSLIVN